MAAVADKVAMFMTITGAEAAYASALLSEHNGDLDLSLSTYYVMQETAGTGAGGGLGGAPAAPALASAAPPPRAFADAGAQIAPPAAAGGPATGGNGGGGGGGPEEVGMDTTGDASLAAMLAAEEAARAGPQEPEVRAPIPSVVDRLIDDPRRAGGGGGAPAGPAGAPATARRRWVGGNSENPFAVAAPLASPYGGDSGVADAQEVPTPGQAPADGAASDRNGGPGVAGLSALFRPPADVTFVGSFDEAMQFANTASKWLLVNIQSATDFASHVLNRDVWARPAARALLDTSYVLWQVEAASTDGRRYLTYYPGASPPIVAVVDPRSGERVCSWDGAGPTGDDVFREAALVGQLRAWAADHVLSSGGDAALAAALAASLEHGEADVAATTTPPAAAGAAAADATRAAGNTPTPPPPPAVPSAEEAAAAAAAAAAHAAAVAAGKRGAPARLVVRLARGGRLQRTWGAADTVGDVRAWVAAALAAEEPAAGGAWQLACVHPRKVFDDDGVTVGEAGLTPSASLVVRRL